MNTQQTDREPVKVLEELTTIINNI